MTRFGHVLQRAESELALPEPQRSRILLEMAQDLDDLYASYRQRGLDEAEAMRRAESMLGVSGGAARELTELHAPAYERVAGRLAARSRNALDATLVTLLTLASVGAAVAVLARSPRLRDPDAVVLGILVVLGAAVLCAASTTVAGALRRNPRRALARLGLLPPLALTSLGLGALGAALDASRLAAATGASLVGSIARIAELLVFALGTALLIALAWFHLQRRLANALEARAALDDWLTSRNGRDGR